jgi:hypothetical protein
MSATALAPAPLEAHFSAAQIAEAWGVSIDTVRRLFEHEPGVLMIEPPQTRFARRRRYRTLRIPASVAERVHRRLSVVNEKGRV